MKSMKRQKNRTLKDEFHRSVGAQYASEVSGEITPERMKRQKKQHPVVDLTGDGSKVRCCNEQYSIGTWNVRSMNQGKLETARVNIDILVIIELK